MGTRVVLACLVDLTRISVYISFVKMSMDMVDMNLVWAATFAAFGGAYFGKKWMQASETTFVNRFIAVAMLLFGIALIVGLV